jgi:hypothetical protein
MIKRKAEDIIAERIAYHEQAAAGLRLAFEELRGYAIHKARTNGGGPVRKIEQAATLRATHRPTSKGLGPEIKALVERQEVGAVTYRDLLDAAKGTPLHRRLTKQAIAAAVRHGYLVRSGAGKHRTYTAGAE